MKLKSKFKILLGTFVTLSVVGTCLVFANGLKTNQYGNLQCATTYHTIHEATEHGSLKDITYFLENGVNINEKDINGRTPLHYAGQVEIIKYLIEHGADVNAKSNYYGRTPLYYRTQNWERMDNVLELIHCLVENGANVNIKDDEGHTPLQCAIEGYEEFGEKIKPIIRYLIEHGADVNTKDNNGKTPLHCATSYGGNLENVKYLVEHGANVNAKDNEGRTPLYNSRYPIAKYLVEHGADINARDNNGRTPLNYRVYENVTCDCYSGKEYTCQIIEFFVKHGADVNAKDKEGFTALDIAQPIYNNHDDYGDPDVIGCLVKLGATHGATHELYCEIFLGNLKRVKQLISENKANVNAGFNSENILTPLQVAVENGNLEIAKYLMEKGAKIQENILYTAVKNGYLDIIKYVFENYKNKIVPNENKQFYTTLLCRAVESKQFKIVKYLIEGQKVSVNETNYRCETPLKIAIKRKNTEIAKYLRKHGGKI